MLAVTLTFAEALNKNVMLLPSAFLPSFVALVVEAGSRH